MTYYEKLLNKPCVEEYVKFAVNLYQDFFDKKIAELLSLFPADYKDKNGKRFWTSPKRPPVALPFQKDCENHLQFVLTCVKILNSIVPLREDCNEEIVKKVLSTLKITRKKLNVDLSKRDKLTDEKA